MAKKLKWTDTEDIAFQLIDRYPSVDPMKLNLSEIQKRVSDLPSFGGSSKVDPEVLEEIQNTWYEERSDMEDELGPLLDEASELDEEDYRDDRMIDEEVVDLGDDSDDDEDELDDGFHEDELDDRE